MMVVGLYRDLVIYMIVYDVYDDSKQYTNATNTPTSDIMKEMVPYLPHRSSSVCVVYWEGWGGC